jgi:hypothetical protein
MIEKAWEGYKKFCVPADAGETQIRETKAAFYSGFITMFEINMKMAEPGFHEMRAMNWLSDLQAEIKRYIKGMQAEKERLEKN